MQTTFPRLLLEHAAARPDAPALREKEFGIWQTLSWSALAALVAALACGLAEAGPASAASTSSSIGENRPRLYASMLAAQSLGAIPVPLYQDAAAAEFVFPIANAEVALRRSSRTRSRSTSCSRCAPSCPQLARIWYDDPRGLRHYGEPGLASLDALRRRRPRLRRRASRLLRRARSSKAQPDDVAAMFFTSGTTGNPKGVVHTHDTLIDRAPRRRRASTS